MDTVARLKELEERDAKRKVSPSLVHIACEQLMYACRALGDVPMHPILSCSTNLTMLLRQLLQTNYRILQGTALANVPTPWHDKH